MWVVRPVVEDDLGALMELAGSLGSGMTTFPHDRPTLARKVEVAVASFAGQLASRDSAFLLALEDSETRRVLGVSAVYPAIGHPFGFFSYHQDRLVVHSPQMDAGLDCAILNLSNVYSGATEIGTLAVAPQARKFGIGKILARARYMLIASFPELFSDIVIAEMRGWQNEAGESPFWLAVGERFFKMDFATADNLSAIKGAEWIANLMPKFPIYLDLLPVEAKEAVGRAHATSAIAMAMLIKEGFRYENYVDVFDAGPQVVAQAQSITTIANSVQAIVSCGPSPSPLSQTRLMCSQDLARFRLISAQTHLENTSSRPSLYLDHKAQQLLDCHEGAIVRCVV